MTIPANFDLDSFAETNDALFDSLSLETKLWGFLYAMRKQQGQLEMLRSQLLSMQGRLDPVSVRPEQFSSEQVKQAVEEINSRIDGLNSLFAQHRREFDALCKCDDNRRDADVSQVKRFQSLEKHLGLVYLDADTPNRRHVTRRQVDLLPEAASDAMNQESHGAPCMTGSVPSAPVPVPAPRPHAKTLVVGVFESKLVSGSDVSRETSRYLMCQYGTRMLNVATYSWELPGGYVGRDQNTVLDSYVRNQTGLLISSMKYVTSYVRVSDDTNVMMFRCEGEGGPPRAGLLGSCVIGHAWMTWQQMHDLSLHGIAPWIVDAMAKYITERMHSDDKDQENQS